MTEPTLTFIVSHTAAGTILGALTHLGASVQNTIVDLQSQLQSQLQPVVAAQGSTGAQIGAMRSGADMPLETSEHESRVPRFGARPFPNDPDETFV